MIVAVRVIAVAIRTPPARGMPGAVARIVATMAAAITTSAAASGVGPSSVPAMTGADIGARPGAERRDDDGARRPSPATPPMAAGTSASSTRNAIRSRRRAPTALSLATSAPTSSRMTRARNTANARRIATPSDPTSRRRPRAASARASAASRPGIGLVTVNAVSSAARSRASAAVASRRAPAVHGWTRSTSSGAVQTYVRPVAIERGRLGHRLHAVHQDDRGTRSAGLVLPATDRLGSRTGRAGRDRRTAPPGRAGRARRSSARHPERAGRCRSRRPARSPTGGPPRTVRHPRSAPAGGPRSASARSRDRRRRR